MIPRDYAKTDFEETVFNEVLDTLLDGWTYRFHFQLSAAVINPYEDDVRERQLEELNRKTEEQRIKDMQSDPAVQPDQVVGSTYTSRKFGNLTAFTVNEIASETVRETGEFKGIALNVKWPKTFLMQAGPDRRKSHKESHDRHAIDWFRSGCQNPVPLPCMERFKQSGNPYEGVIGCSDLRIAFEVMRNNQEMGQTQLVDEVMSNIGGKKKDMKARSRILEGVADLCLFGFIRRFEVKAGAFTADKSIYVFNGSVA